MSQKLLAKRNTVEENFRETALFLGLQGHIFRRKQRILINTQNLCVKNDLVCFESEETAPLLLYPQQNDRWRITIAK